MSEQFAPPARCLRCHRPIACSSSLRAGVGPTCRARLRAPALQAVATGGRAALIELVDLRRAEGDDLGLGAALDLGEEIYR